MKKSEETARVWVGLNLLQAQMLKQMLEDNGVECIADRDPGVIPAGELGEIGLWVGRNDEQRARRLLQQMEDRMSADLDREISEEKEND